MNAIWCIYMIILNIFLSVVIACTRKHKQWLFIIFVLYPLQPLYAEQNAWAVCAGIENQQQRLDCYDKMQANTGVQGKKDNTQSGSVSRSYLTRSWDLDHRDDELLDSQQSPLRPHRVSYLIARHSSSPNAMPQSPTHGVPVVPPDTVLNEIKFQISQKGKMLNPVQMDFLGFTGFRLWGAYTQQSNWQAFNTGNSAPFRETNYEPELILTFYTGNTKGLRLINLGYAHQSNGRSLESSRSWNRMYAQGGWERGALSVLARVWWRVPEEYTSDDNPDIEEYVGRGEIAMRWEGAEGNQVVDLSIRNNFRLGENRGLLQLDWATPLTVSKSTQLHVQMTTGYGESLIDYNHYQTTFGLGVSFRDW